MQVLVLAAHGEDFQVIRDVLAATGQPTMDCDDAQALLSALARGAGCAILPGEALGSHALDGLADWVGR
ncbi:hypothetical protein [Bordetella sp. H567]|uniref:hypothetical protein n=1 Tax=Bordetella sp. H567 TaxID=1697043 RepID=UPI0026A21790